jgi:hypothetical protein
MDKPSAQIARFFRLCATTSIAMVPIGRSSLPLSNSRSTRPSVRLPANLHSRSFMAISLAYYHLRSTTIPRPRPWTSSKPECCTISKLRMRLLPPKRNNRNARIEGASIQLPLQTRSTLATMSYACSSTRRRRTGRHGSYYNVGLVLTKSHGMTVLGRRTCSISGMKRLIPTFTSHVSSCTLENPRISNGALGFPLRSALTISKSPKSLDTDSNSTMVCNFCVNGNNIRLRTLPIAMRPTSSNQQHVSSSRSTFAVSGISLRISKHGPCNVHGLWIRQDDLRLRCLHPPHLVRSLRLW